MAVRFMKKFNYIKKENGGACYWLGDGDSVREMQERGEFHDGDLICQVWPVAVVSETKTVTIKMRPLPEGNASYEVINDKQEPEGEPGGRPD